MPWLDVVAAYLASVDTEPVPEATGEPDRTEGLPEEVNRFLRHFAHPAGRGSCTS